MWRKIRAILSQGMLATVASQCGGSDGAIFVPDGDDEGTITIVVTDAPTDDATQVLVEFTSVDLIAADNRDDFTFDLNDRGVDLLALSDGASTALVNNQTVESGDYSGIRFTVNASSGSQDGSFIDLSDGSRFPLVIPNNGDDGLEVSRNFTIPEDGSLTLVVDFDLRRSIVEGGSTYTFRPVLRVVDNANVGIISGSVDADLIPTNCSPFIYVFSGSSVTPDDIDNASDVDPLVSVPVKLNVSSGLYRYRASFLEAGSYTVAFTCNGASDDPESSDPLVFSGTTNATVTANQTLTLDFT